MSRFLVYFLEMSFLSGTKFNYERRLHQLAATSGVFSQFLAEKAGFSNVPTSMLKKWEREEAKKKIILKIP
jgi:hypothetical protein